VNNIAVLDAYERFNKTKKTPPQEISSPLSVRDTGELPTVKISTEWTSEEQKLLEKALGAYSSSLTDRWDKIAAAIPGKTKKECVERYKFLVAQIKEKKAVQEKK